MTVLQAMLCVNIVLEAVQIFASPPELLGNMMRRAEGEQKFNKKKIPRASRNLQDVQRDQHGGRRKAYKPYGRLGTPQLAQFL